MPMASVRSILTGIRSRLGLTRDWYLIVISAGIGVVTAGFAIAFIDTIRWLGPLVRRWMQSDLGWVWVVAIPAIGALLTGVLVHVFAPETKGHGVPEVLYALHKDGGRIRPRVAVVKALTSICTITSGGSAGAEGPIVQIGAALGSAMARVLRVSRDQVPTLLGCGAAAGIASVFNAPIAGVFFVLEVLLRDFSVRTFTPIVVAAVFSAAATQAYNGENAALFTVSPEMADYHFSFLELPAYVGLGVVCAIVAVVFTRSLYWTEDRFAQWRVHPITKPVIGAVMLGLLGIGWFWAFGSQYNARGAPLFFGNGYGTIGALLDPATYTGASEGLPETRVNPTVVFLGVLTIAKLAATSFTLGSGGSGGLFAPSLFLGASLGGSVGVWLDRMGLVPASGSPAAYALVGMAAMVAGTTHAPLTAMLLLFELTRDVYVLLPIMLAAVVATMGAQVLLHDSIYTFPLRRRGLRLGTVADHSLLRRLTAASVAPVETAHIRVDEPLSRLQELRGYEHITDFIVVDGSGAYVGLVTGRDLRAALQQPSVIPYLVIDEIVRRDLPTIRPDDTLDTVMREFARHEVNSLALVDEHKGHPRVVGLITRIRLMERYQRELERR